MTTEVGLAVAGSGKTGDIVESIKSQPLNVTSLALTFTRQAQGEIERRLPSGIENNHETMGWFSFLTRHIIRPYLPAVYSGILPRGLCFVESAGMIPRGRGNWKYYFNDDFQPYSARLSLLAKKVIRESASAPIRRLEQIYDKIYIDEFQDLVGNDLEVLDALMRSSIDILLVGDVRQSVLKTSSSDRLHQDYRGAELVNWFRKQENEGLCSIVVNEVTTRFNQQIADFSDLIHDPELLLPATTSIQSEVTGHDGVFLVDEKHLGEYFSAHSEPPTILRYRDDKQELPNGEIQTFGKAKGITRDRVIILATSPIVKLLKLRTQMTSRSASGFYVAVTRARYSVAIIVKGASRVHEELHRDFQGKITLWEPRHV